MSVTKTCHNLEAIIVVGISRDENSLLFIRWSYAIAMSNLHTDDGVDEEQHCNQEYDIRQGLDNV